MMKTSHGSLALFIGASTGLFIALLSSLIISLVSSPAPEALAEGRRMMPKIRAELARSYTELVPPTVPSVKARSGETYFIKQKKEGCALFDQSAPSTTIATIQDPWCTLSGASIEGRYIHILSGETTTCLLSANSCESAPISAWNIFDLRTHVLRTVPVPVLKGTWEAIDSTRSMGLFRGAVRSTIRPGEEDFWALTDAAGAAFWTGRIDDVDLKAQIIAGERLLSRSDNDLILSYLVIDPEGNEVLRLATFNGKVWKRIELPESLNGKTWRLESWLLEAGKWKATVVWRDEEGKLARVKVAT